MRALILGSKPKGLFPSFFLPDFLPDPIVFFIDLILIALVITNYFNETKCVLMERDLVKRITIHCRKYCSAPLKVEIEEINLHQFSFCICVL